MENISLERDVEFSVAEYGKASVAILAVRKSGERFAITLSGPLTNDYSAAPFLKELVREQVDLQLVVVNELIARGNLPAATREITQRIGA